MSRTSSSEPFDLNKVVTDLKNIEWIVERLLIESTSTSQQLTLLPTTTENIQTLINAVVDKVKALPGQMGVHLKQELEVRLKIVLKKWRAVQENTNTLTTCKFPDTNVAKKPEAVPLAKNTFKARVAIDNSAGASFSGSSFSRETLNSSSSFSLPEEFTSESVKSTLTTLSPKTITNTTTINFVGSGTPTNKTQISDDLDLSCQLVKSKVEKQLEVSPISTYNFPNDTTKLIMKVDTTPKLQQQPSSSSLIDSSEKTFYPLLSISEILEKLNRSIKLFFALNCPLNALPKIEELERTVQLIPLSEPKLIDQWKDKVASIRNHFTELTNCQENGGTLATQQQQSIVKSLSNLTTVYESLSEHGPDKLVAVLNSTTTNAIETAGEGHHNNGTNTFDAFYRQGQMEEEMNQLKATIEAHIEADEEEAVVSGIISLAQLVETYVKEFGANDGKWNDQVISLITRFVEKPQKEQSNIESEDDDNIYGYICPIQSYSKKNYDRV